VQDLLPFRMRDSERPAPDRCDASDDSLIERVAQGVPANHTSRADDDETLRTDQFRHDGMSQADSVLERRSYMEFTDVGSYSFPLRADIKSSFAFHNRRRTPTAAL
jgi:hypothetical protein